MTAGERKIAYLLILSNEEFKKWFTEQELEEMKNSVVDGIKYDLKEWRDLLARSRGR